MYVANVTDTVIRFTATEDESITGVRIKPTGRISYYNFYLGDWAFEETDAVIRVYKGAFDAAAAADAEPVYMQKYTIVYPDYQTVAFNEAVGLTKGEEYYVRVTFDSPVPYAIDGAQQLFWSYRNAAKGNPGETYLRVAKSEGTGEWYDTADIPGEPSSSACIKVLTKNVVPAKPVDEEPAVPNTTSSGTGEGWDAPSGGLQVWLIPAVGVLAAGAAAGAIIAVSRRRAKR